MKRDFSFKSSQIKMVYSYSMKVQEGILLPYLLNLVGGLAFLSGLFSLEQKNTTLLLTLGTFFFLFLPYIGGKYIGQHIKTHYLFTCIGVYIVSLLTLYKCGGLIVSIIFVFWWFVLIPWFLSLIAGCIVALYQTKKERTNVK